MAGLRYAVALAVLASLSGIALAQIPSLGWCPEYVPMADFSMERYLGTWYEAERYFTVLEAGSRCVSTNYTKAVDGRVLVSNQITNRLTGIKRVVEGEIRNVVKGAESKLNVKYSTLPVPFETTYSVLDSDYDSYAVVYSCSSIGPLRTQNAWVMTRERLAPGTVLQMAYGVLDKYKISRTFFVKTDQADCAIAEAAAAEREQAERKAALAAAAQEGVAEKSAAPLPSPVAAPVPAPVAVPAPAPIPVAAAAAEAVPVAAAEPLVPAIPVIPSVVAAPVAAVPVQADAPAFVPLPIALAEKPVEIIPAPVAAPVVPVAAVVAADPVAVPEAPLEAAKPPKPAVVPEVAAAAPVAAEPVKAL